MGSSGCRPTLPVADPPGEMEAGVLQVGIEVGQQEVPPALGADVGRPALVHALVGAEAATVGHDHRTAVAHLDGGEQKGGRLSTLGLPALLLFPQRGGRLHPPSSNSVRVAGEVQRCDAFRYGAFQAAGMVLA